MLISPHFRTGAGGINKCIENKKKKNRNVVSMVACRSPKSRGACSNQAIPEFNGSLINLVFFVFTSFSSFPPFLLCSQCEGK